jgi:hypothetical protein
VTDKQLIKFATAFRDGILDGDPSRRMCAAVSWPLAALLRCNGVDCETVETDLGDCNHIWIKLADGRALDPTADQFNYPFFKQYPPVYLGPPTELHGCDSDAMQARKAAGFEPRRGRSAGRRHRPKEGQ